MNAPHNSPAPLIFVGMVRHAGARAADLLRQIGQAALPGDHVLILEDSGSRYTLPHIARMLAHEGWPEGVGRTLLATGSPAQGDQGLTVNLALAQMAIPGAMPGTISGGARVLFLTGGTRLNPEALHQARCQADAGGHDLFLLPWHRWSLDLGREVEGPEAPFWSARPGEPPAERARRLFPTLQGLLIDHALLQGLYADEDRQAYGTLGLVWHLLTTARNIGIGTESLGHGPDISDVHPALIAAAKALLASDPQAKAALSGYIGQRLPQLTPGARGALLTAALHEQPRGEPQDPARAETGVLAMLQARHRAQLVELLPTAGAAPTSSAPPSPPLTGRAKIRLCLAGRHARLMPFSWATLQPLWQDVAEITQSPDQADLVLWAHAHDVKDADNAAATRAARQVLFSEEPFWDTIFGPDPLARHITLTGPEGAQIGLHQVNHHRSAVYDFAQIPYFLLTRPEYATRYAALFARNARRSAADWHTAFSACPRDLVFMAERRRETYHDVAWPEGDILGLCAWRTRLAEAMSAPDLGLRTEKIGASWGNGPSRFTLGDWHLDKLNDLDGQLRQMSALENTHQPTYLSEKLFDAFAVGARPLYMASPGHRVHDLGLPEEAWINLWGLSVGQARQKIMTTPWDKSFFTAYAEAQNRLAQLWTDAALLTTERARLGRALGAELRRLADYG